MTTGTQNPPPDALDANGQVSKAVDTETETPEPRPPDRAGLWWLAAIVAVVSAAGLTVVVARGTHFTTGQRAAAAGTALLVVVALAIVAQIILTWYQAQLSAADQEALLPRRQGLRRPSWGTITVPPPARPR